MTDEEYRKKLENAGFRWTGEKYTTAGGSGNYTPQEITPKKLPSGMVDYSSINWDSVNQMGAQSTADRILGGGGTVESVRQTLMGQGWNNEDAVNFVKNLRQPSASSFPQSKGYTLEESVAMSKPKTAQVKGVKLSVADYNANFIFTGGSRPTGGLYKTDIFNQFVDDAGNVWIRGEGNRTTMAKPTSKPISAQGSFDAEGNWQSSSQPGAISTSSPFESYLNDLQTKLDKFYGTQQTSLEGNLNAGIAGTQSDYAQREQTLRGEQAKESGAYAAKLKRMSGGLGESSSALGAMASLDNLHQQAISNLTVQKNQVIQSARAAFDDKNFALAESQIKSAMDLEQKIYDREKENQTTKDNIAKDQIAKATALADGIAAILSGDPETDEKAYNDLSAEYDVGVDYLKSAVAKIKAGIKPELKEVGGILYEHKDGKLVKVEGQETTTEGLSEADKQKAALDYAKNNGISYSEAYDALFGSTATGGTTGGGTGTVVSGSLAEKNNNPGNLRFIGQEGATQGTGGFAAFPTMEAGWQALKNDLLYKISSESKTLGPEKTLLDLANRYAPRADGNDPDQWASQVAQYTGGGITPQTKLKDLAPLIDQFTNAVAKKESSYNPNATISAKNQLNVEDATFLQDKTSQQQQIYLGLNAQDKSNVRQLISGDILLGDLGAGIKGAAMRQKYNALAVQIDPNFSETTNKQRYSFKQTKWNNGKLFDNRTAINTALGHMGTLMETSKALNNVKLPTVTGLLTSQYNTIKNWISKNSGNPQLVDFQYNLTVLASEIASAYKGGTAPTDQETEKIYQAMASNFSPTQFSSVLSTSTKLMSSKLTSMAQEYKNIMGSYPDEPIVQTYILDELRNAGVDVSAIDTALKQQGYQSNSATSPTTSISRLGLNPNEILDNISQAINSIR